MSHVIAGRSRGLTAQVPVDAASALPLLPSGLSSGGSYSDPGGRGGGGGGARSPEPGASQHVSCSRADLVPSQLPGP